MFIRTVKVETLECTRLGKGWNKGVLCAKAGISPASYNKLLAHKGVKTTDDVLTKVLKALGLSHESVLCFQWLDGDSGAVIRSGTSHRSPQKESCSCG
jgi:hypothetical protein